MTFATYELYYLDSYDDHVADVVDDFDLDRDDPGFEEEVAWHIDAEYVIDYGVKAAVIVHDLDTHEVEVALVQPGSPHAPEWYTDEDVLAAATELQCMLVALDDHTVRIVEPQDPAFALKRCSAFQAESLSTATVAMIQDSQDNAFYTVFCIEFRPNLMSDFSFPVAVFAFDPRIGRITGHMLLDDNPFAPPTFNRKQRKIVERRLAELLQEVQVAAATGSETSPFKNLGPQFRSEGLPTVEAVDTHHAIDQSIEYLKRYYAERAS